MGESSTVNIVYVAGDKDDYQPLAGMLGDLEWMVESHTCSELDSVKTLHSQGRCDLVVYWSHSGKLEARALADFLRAAPDPPALILMVKRPDSGDFVEAASMAAVDVVNTKAPAQFPFAVQRELRNRQMRRQYHRALKKLDEEYVVDVTDYSVSEDDDTISPMVSTIDEALKNNRFELLFQPILAVKDDGYDNYEIFLRIKTPEGTLMPDEFLPVAEQYGLMPAIDRWVVKHAIHRFKAEQEVRRLKKAGRPLRFFLNISVHSLVDEVVMGSIVSEIVRAKLEPGSFVVELHKNTILSRLQKAKSLNQNMKKLKLEFAIDHYEAKDNTLNYLKHVSLDFIKLNREMMEDVLHEPEKQEGIREIVDKARENNIKVIASQVEEASVLPLLYSVGIDYIQGFLIAEPGTRLERAVIDASLDEVSG